VLAAEQLKGGDRRQTENRKEARHAELNGTATKKQLITAAAERNREIYRAGYYQVNGTGPKEDRSNLHHDVTLQGERTKRLEPHVFRDKEKWTGNVSVGMKGWWKETEEDGPRFEAIRKRLIAQIGSVSVHDVQGDR